MWPKGRRYQVERGGSEGRAITGAFLHRATATLSLHFTSQSRFSPWTGPSQEARKRSALVFHARWHITFALFTQTKSRSAIEKAVLFCTEAS